MAFGFYKGWSSIPSFRKRIDQCEKTNVFQKLSASRMDVVKVFVFNQSIFITMAIDGNFMKQKKCQLIINFLWHLAQTIDVIMNFIPIASGWRIDFEQQQQQQFDAHQLSRCVYVAMLLFLTKLQLMLYYHHE